MALLQRLSFIILLISLIGCGSGEGGLNGGSSSPDPVDTDAITLMLTISNVNVTEQNPATITATVLQGTTPLSGKLVTFSTTLGSFSPEIGTALTDSAGTAAIVLNAGDVSGAGEVTATVAGAEDVVIGFTTQAASAVVLRLGSVDPFVEGEIDVSLPQISAGGTTVVSVSIVDDQNNLYTESVELSFTSVCVEETVPSATLSSPVTTSSGIATSTYLAKGCVGDDPISVNAIVGGKNLSASGVVNVLPANVGSIEFVSSTPETIGIIGTGAVGGSESSTIIFRVLDTNGNPVNNQEVDFKLNTATGGVNLIPARATTNNLGLVQTVVNSGTVATSVRVQATVVESDPVISSQSSVLVVSTGIPDQDSFSLSAEILNPEGWDIDGTEVMITARLADAYNNPVPNGTAVNFTTEGGSIESSCLTVGGACSVTWTSQLPRPEGHILGDINNLNHRPETLNTMGQKWGGRATIIATAIGEESFPDLNGNGRFDESEMAAFAGNDVSGQPYDRKEAYADYNEDGFYNPGETNGAEQAGGELEEFVDFNNDGVFSQNDGLYNGVLCSIPSHAGCAVNEQSINVRGQLVLVMSGSSARFVTTQPAGGATMVIQGEGTANGSVIISDLHNQPMPAGSKVEFSVAGFGSVVSEVAGNWPSENHNGGSEYTVTVKGEKDDLPKSGTLWVSVTTPSGVISSYPVANILIQ